MHFILVFIIFGMPSQVGQIRFEGKMKKYSGLATVYHHPHTLDDFNIQHGFLRGNGFRLKNQCKFHVWALCCGFCEF